MTLIYLSVSTKTAQLTYMGCCINNIIPYNYVLKQFNRLLQTNTTIYVMAICPMLPWRGIQTLKQMNNISHNNKYTSKLDPSAYITWSHTDGASSCGSQRYSGGAINAFYL